MSALDLATLRLVVAVDTHGSINAAAASLGITQPAASARLREFEARWRLTVAARTPRGTTLTPDGEAVAGWARRVLAEADSMESGLRALTAERAGSLAVAASLTVAEFLLPRWMGRLHAEHPAVRPHLQVVNSEAVLEAVRGDRAALGFVESAEPPAGFECRVVGYDTVAVAVRPDHPWARRSYPVPLDQLLEEAYVLREPGSGTRSTFERALRRVPAVAMEASSTQTLLGAALAGAGPTVLSGLALRPHLERGDLVAVRTGLDLRRPLTAVWNRGQRLPAPARDLLAIAVALSDADAATAVREPGRPGQG